MGSLLGNMFGGYGGYGGYGNPGGSLGNVGMSGMPNQNQTAFPQRPQQYGGNYGDLFSQWTMPYQPQRPQGYGALVQQNGQAGMGGGRVFQPPQTPIENTAQQPQPDSQGRAAGSDLLWNQPLGDDWLTGRTGLIR